MGLALRDIIEAVFLTLGFVFFYYVFYQNWLSILITGLDPLMEYDWSELICNFWYVWLFYFVDGWSMCWGCFPYELIGVFLVSGLFNLFFLNKLFNVL